MARTRLLVTGAAGGVAKLLLPALDGYDLVLTDRVPISDGITGNLADPDFVAEITAGVDAIVHLAANPDPRASWDELRGSNVEAAVHVLNSGVGKVVLAGSAHAMGQYVAGGRVPVNPGWTPVPCCAYGATKAFVEAYGRASAYRSGSSVVALRLGATTAEPAAVEALPSWLGPEDLRRLVLRALEAKVRFAVCHGVSANTRSVWDIRNDIGYRPVQDSEAYADSVPDIPGWGPCAGAGRG